MNILAKKATLLGIFGNMLLFILKVIVGFLYNSIAVISDAFNSLTDIVASVIVYISVKVASKRADKGHPFGHHRAEPIAGLIVAIFTGIVGFEVIKIAFTRLLAGEKIVISLVPVFVMGFTLLLKLFMYVYTKNVGKKIKSTAILASSVDHRNDVLISIAVLAGVSGAYFGYEFLDPLVALVIGLWIIKAGYGIGKDNINFLMGVAPGEELMNEIRKTALSVKGVRGVHDVRAHYVGVLLQIEVHISVNKKLVISKAHSIGKNVSEALEKLEDVDRAFVHIDPV